MTNVIPLPNRTDLSDRSARPTGLRARLSRLRPTPMPMPMSTPMSMPTALGRVADAGMTTAEYAVGTVAACAFAALLYKIVTSGWVSAALAAVVKRALHAV